MMNLSVKIQMVIDTIQGVEIKATRDNVDRILGCIQLLESIQDDARNILHILHHAEGSDGIQETPVETEVEEIEPAKS